MTAAAPLNTRSMMKFASYRSYKKVAAFTKRYMRIPITVYVQPDVKFSAAIIDDFNLSRLMKLVQ